MVVNLARWVDEGIGPAATAVFTERPHVLTFNDQCALNAVLAGRYRRLPFRWNHLNGSAPRDWPISLVHYAGHFKPWNLGLLGRHANIVTFVGGQNMEYYVAALSDLRSAHIIPGMRTVLQLSIYAKWHITGKLEKSQNRARSNHLKTHIADNPHLVD